MPDVALTPSDYLVVSEVYGPVIHDIQPGVPKVIFNQGCYLTFHGYSLEKKDDDPPYLHPDVKAVLVVSEDSRAYLSHVFPGLWIHRLRYGIEPSLFRPRLWYRPAATATKPVFGKGTLHWASELSPQATIEPSVFRPRLWSRERPTDA